MPIRKKDKHGRIAIYGRVRIRGQERAKKCKTMAEARAWEAAFKAAASTNWNQPDTVSLRELANSYLDDVQARCSHRHYQDVARGLTAFVLAMGADTPAQDIRKGSVAQFLKGLARRKGPKRANRIRVFIVGCWNWARYECEFPPTGQWETRPFKTEEPRRPVYSGEELEKLLKAADDDWRVMLTCYIETAARKQELFHLLWQDVDLEAKTMRLRTRKRRGGMESDLCPLPDYVCDMLREHRLRVGPQKHVFTRPVVRMVGGRRLETREPFSRDTHMLQTIAERAGVEYKGFHAIRRFAATVVGKELGIGAAYDLLRHRNYSTTDRYIRPMVGQDRAPGVADLFKKRTG
ncbi:tyrosine-type recombinase/integrase [Desulfocurvus sp. DL9XJH121]